VSQVSGEDDEVWSFFETIDSRDGFLQSAPRVRSEHYAAYAGELQKIASIEFAHEYPSLI